MNLIGTLQKEGPTGTFFPGPDSYVGARD